MNFSDKYVFLISDVDKFFYLFADALVHKCGTPADSIIAIVHKSPRIETLDRRAPFEYIDFEQCKIEELLESKIFVPISLSTWNAPIVKKLIQEDQKFIEKTYVLITDDEVDRWSQIKSKNGRLTVDESLMVSQDVLSVAENIKNFIVTKAYFEKKLQEILGRKKFGIVDASIIFDILPYHESENLRKALFLRSDVPRNRVMIGTNGVPLREAIRVVHSFRKVKNLQFVIFSMPVYKRIILEFYLLGMRVFFKKKISMMYLEYLLPAAYNAIVASCSVLVMQRRGGGSTARLFVKWGCGFLIVKSNSENGKVLREVFGVEYREYGDSTELNSDVIDKNEVVSKNSSAVINEEIRSVAILKDFFN